MVPSIIPYGDSALLVNFEQRIDREIHQEVLTLYGALINTAGIRYMIPAYCSLTVVFDPGIIAASDLQEQIQEVVMHKPEKTLRISPQLHSLPVCYDPEFGPDLDELSTHLGKPVEAIIRAHLETEFYVYMVGFLPGFAYMGDMPEEFNCPRKSSPRTKVPAGSVGLAARQTAIYPFESPGGWQLIGRSPVVMFDPLRERPSLLQAGDHVRFIQIGKEEFQKIASGS